jgi:hypothetical protein
MMAARSPGYDLPTIHSVMRHRGLSSARPSATILAPSEATRGVVVILDHQDDHARWESGTRRRRRVVRGIEGSLISPGPR